MPIRMIKKYALLAMSLLLVSGFALAGSGNNPEKGNNDSWLYMVHGDDAAISTSDSGEMLLTISAQKSLAERLEDRPLRKIERVSIQNLKDVWNTSTDASQKSLSKTALIHEKKVGIIVLTGMVIKDDDVVFSFKMDDQTKEPFINGEKGHFVMVIDGLPNS